MSCRRGCTRFDTLGYGTRPAESRPRAYVNTCCSTACRRTNGSERAKMPTARRPIAPETKNLAYAPAAGPAICCMSVVSHRNGHKDHDVRRLRDRSETAPDHARLNRAAGPYCSLPVSTSSDAPPWAISSPHRDVQSWYRQLIGALADTTTCMISSPSFDDQSEISI
jgi:hypothetical protein